MIFSQKATNLGRQAEVDLVRGFAALNIIICHVGLYLGSSSNTGLYVFCDIYGSEFGAPIFMTLMGISIAYSRHQTPSEILKRGIRLLLGGYALSFYRSILPLLIWGAVDEWASVEAFFVVDILQLAGLTFLFLALLRKLKLPNIVILAVSAVMVVIDQLIMLPASVPWDSKLLTGLINLFCPVSDWSCFPFLTWFFFPAFGLVFGDMLTHCTSKKKLYSVLLPTGFLGVMYVYYRFHLLYPDYTSYYWGNNFFYMGLKNVVLTALFICFALSFWFFAEKHLPAPVRKFLDFLSRNLNIFYVISWLIISVLIHSRAIDQWTLSAPASVGMMVLLIILCAVLTRLYHRLLSFFRRSASSVR